jgi:hypothetical protein
MSFRRTISLAAFSFCILHSAFCIASDTWTLSTADFRSEPVTLRAIDEKGVHVGAAGSGGAGEVRVVPPDAFLQIDRTLAACRSPRSSCCTS